VNLADIASKDGEPKFFGRNLALSFSPNKKHWRPS
jgi:hypothetical protein